MPTSATGASRPSQRAGFTLVELMVVITVIGLAATAVVLSAPDPKPSVSVEAERLAARLVMARDEAILSNRSLAVTMSADGYRFQAFDGVDWQPLTGALKGSQWSQGVAPAQTARLVFEPTGATEPVEIHLSKDNRNMTVSVDGAGEVSLAP